jgi:hypothetical protein
VSAAPAATAPATSESSAVISRYCATCHNERLKTANLVLSDKDIDNPAPHADIWEKVVRKLRSRTMPPAGVPRPDEATYESVASSLEAALDQAAAADPNPGRPTVAHRLNRAEYTNAVGDLLALEIDGAALLPSDDSGGFDNLGDLLSVSPTLMEKYLSAAGKISRLAIGDPQLRPDVYTYTISPYLVQGDRMSEDLPFGSRGGTAIRHHFPLDGEYVIKVRLQRTDGAAYVIGLAEPRKLDVRINDERVKLLAFGGESVGLADGAGAADAVPPDFNQAQYERHADDKLEVRVPVKAGTRLVQVSFLKENWAPEGAFTVGHQRTYAEGGAEHRSLTEPMVSSISISGPFGNPKPGDTPSRKKIFTCYPASATEEEPCATNILRSLARRAYRRPVAEADVEPLVELYRQGRTDGDFETGMQLALQGLLVSTEFLFRLEPDPPGLPSGSVYPVSQLELASRLSFFLWSSIPDEELLSLAEEGKLKDTAVLEQQVRRMLADPRAKALIDNFAGQWLQLRNLKTKTPNRDVFPEFDESLRTAFEQETDLFLKSILREDRSVLDLLDADYTFVNERLARHYGIPGVYGTHFRRVTVSDENRKGLLGHGSILTLTALANRTSPVERGQWVLENILNAPVPDPPPNIPALKEKGEKGAQDLPMRQQMEAHRKNPACIGCHARMDPIGFALEKFDAIGRWREMDASLPIDASGVLLDGSKFDGPGGLRKALLSRPELIAYAFAEKLMTYALGRHVEYYDAPAIRKIVRDAQPSKYQWSSMVLGIVKSVPFQMRRSRTS